jgi:hypothetical protein
MASCAKITEDHTIGDLVADADELATALPWHLDGRRSRAADVSLRDLRIGDRYRLRSGGLSPIADDRPHSNVVILRAKSADAPAKLATPAGDRPACRG